ncbi:hypothetical protein Ddye_018154 [Dipteronia dyeriana]|uniref:Protein FAR1-RELATED SEQUENCE n=1 Tax=Dipteronia dyeriana TaxID=168575 RepID=A0AAD9UAZ7_9ROSI|nr:hypothetical protein Ddye_018154 [Dipteronia dyeriana]
MESIVYTFKKFARGDKTWKVRYTPSPNIFKSSCKTFEILGIPCCHAFSVMKATNQQHIPETLIMQRWIMIAKDGLEFESSSATTTTNIMELASAMASNGDAIMEPTSQPTAYADFAQSWDSPYNVHSDGGFHPFAFPNTEVPRPPFINHLNVDDYSMTNLSQAMYMQ